VAQLIGHYYDEKGVFGTFCISGLRETSNLYVKTDETQSNAPDVLDNWEAFNKYQLGRLQLVGDGSFTMYALKEDLLRFKEKVTAALSFRQNVRIAAGKGSR